MAAMFGHSWVSQYGPAPDGVGGDTWAGVLAGLNGAQIGQGLQALTRIPSDWPPTAPKFRALCLGVPALPQVRIELRAGNPEPSPFARLLWSYLDGYAYRRADADKADRMLRDAYELASAYVMDGGALPEPVAHIGAPEAEVVKVAAPEVAKRYIEEISSVLGQPAPFSSDVTPADAEPVTDFRSRAAGPDA